MVRSIATGIKRLSAAAGGPDRVSILLSFLIISAGLGVLAWRSYELSLRMERGANTLAVQLAGYAAEITARRVDAAIGAEVARASEQWQQIERRSADPDPRALREWINAHDWIVSAMYVPDADPASSVFVSEIADADDEKERQTRELFTSSGTVTYTYDTGRLLALARSTVAQQPRVPTPSSADTLRVSLTAGVTLVPNAGRGIVRSGDGYAFLAPLAPPLASHAVRAEVRTVFAGSGWWNQRVVSASLSLLAVILTALGFYLAYRGLRKESETTKLRGALIANVSHELRTPLSMIRLGAETLMRATKLKEKERRDIEESILREVLHLSHLVENVLDVARIQNRAAKALAFTPVQPRELVSALVSTYGSWIHSKGFEVTVEADEKVAEQMWDRDAVSRALLNLVDNAIKYSADDRRIAICLRQTESDVVLEVRDHGIGIEQRELVRIFDPYYRARFSDTQTRRGAGLGLTLVQQIVASHGGRIEVESVAGEGSKFRLLFPRSDGSEARRVTSVAAASTAF